MIEVLEKMLALHQSHRWKFFRAGGLDQVVFRNGTDIADLESLDQKLWVALSCPTRGVDVDPKTLELIDTEKNGRIRVGELLSTVKWTLQQIKQPDALLKGAPDLPLELINETSDSGAVLLAAAKRILANLGKPEAACITLADIADTKKIFLQTQFNGDGIVPAHAAAEAETQKVLEDIIACFPGTEDRSGKPGVNQANLEAFFAQAKALSDWAAKAESDKVILFFGKATGPAAEAVQAVRVKVEDYFARCHLATFDARAVGPLNRAVEEYVALAAKDLTRQAPEIAKLPLARIEPGSPLPLRTGINPAWATAMARFAVDVVAPLLGKDKAALTEEEWTDINTMLAPYEAWIAAKPATVIEKLGLERLRAILASPAKGRIEELIKQDAKLEAEYAQVNAIDKLIRFHRDLKRLLHNYVSFADFYNPKIAAIFQIGRLYMDGRACDLCFHVDDIAKHATLATPSRIYLAYCDLVRPSTGQKRTICAAFTAGFAETLWVGRNGIFYDLQGNDWDAVIVKVVENPVSLKEAFWHPWKKLAAVITEQVKKLLASREEAIVTAASKSVESMGKQPAPGAKGPAAPAPMMDGAAIASSVAAIGIAVGLLSQAAAKLFDATKGIEVWQAMAGVGSVILAVSGPSVIISYFKLRARDLAPILNACGWAVNSRIRMTLRLGGVLTQEAKVPLGSERQLTDPYADDNRMRNLVITLLLLAGLVYGLWKFDFLDRWLPTALRHHAAVPVKTEAPPPPAPAVEAPKK